MHIVARIMCPQLTAKVVLVCMLYQTRSWVKAGYTFQIIIENFCTVTNLHNVMGLL